MSKKLGTSNVVIDHDFERLESIRFARDEMDHYFETLESIQFALDAGCLPKSEDLIDLIRRGKPIPALVLKHIKDRLDGKAKARKGRPFKANEPEIIQRDTKVWQAYLKVKNDLKRAILAEARVITTR